MYSETGTTRSGTARYLQRKGSGKTTTRDRYRDTHTVRHVQQDRYRRYSETMAGKAGQVQRNKQHQDRLREVRYSETGTTRQVTVKHVQSKR